VCPPPNPTLDEKKIPDHHRCPDDFAEVVAAFEHDLYRRGRSEPTVATYASALRAFAPFYRDDLKKPGPYVSRLQETDLRAFVDHLRDKRHLTATSVNRYVAALRAFSTFLLTRNWHRRLLARDLRTYRVAVSSEPTRLSKDEVRRLVGAINLNGRNGKRNYAIVQLFLQCGLRVGELARLSRDDVTIHRTVGRLRVRSDKGHAERTLPLNSTARRAIDDYLDTEHPVAGAAPLFLSEQHRRLSVKAIQHLVKKYLCMAGREELSTHDLRHHFAAEFYARSGKLTATQQVLGHRDINTTARYARATQEEIDKTIDALDDER